MITVKEIIEFLKSKSDLKCKWQGDKKHEKIIINSINKDTLARTGQLAWVSKKNIDNDHTRINSYKGSLLIGPYIPTKICIPYISCSNPKLTYIFVVNEFFTHLTKIIWNGNSGKGDESIKISDQAKLSPGIVLGSNVFIEEDVEIGPNTVLANCVIKQGTRIGANCSIGLPGFGYEKDSAGNYWHFPHIGSVIIDENVEIGSSTCIDRGSIGDTYIGKGVKIDNLVHIAHNVCIEQNSIVIANSMIGGSVSIDKDVWIAPSASIMNQISVGSSSIIGMGAVVLKNVEEQSIMVGNPAKLLRRNSDE